MTDTTQDDPELKRVELQREKLSLETDRLELDRLRSEVKGDLYGNDRYREYWFTDEVTKKSIKKALKTVTRWHRESPKCPIRFVINSPGGYCEQGLHLYDELYGMSLRGGGQHHVTTVVRGEACSMGSVLSQVGDERLMGPNALMMIHQASYGTIGTFGKMRDDVAMMAKLCDILRNIYVERSGIPEPQFVEAWERKDWWLTAFEARTLNLVDRIG